MIFDSLSIRTKLTLVMTLLLAITSVAVFVYFPARLKAQTFSSVEQKAAVLTEMTAYSLAKGMSNRDLPAIAEVLNAMRRTSDLVYIVIVDNDGTSYTGFNQLAANDLNFRTVPMQRLSAALPMPGRASLPRLQNREALYREIDGGITRDGLVYQTTAPIRYEGRPVGRLYIGMSLQAIQADIARSRATIALVTVIAFMVGVLAVFALSTLITGPLKRIVETAEKIAEGDLSMRADVRSDDEVGQLASAFNTMIERVHGAWRELEQWGKTLEVRVQERTRELSDEVEERRRAEEALRASEERYRLLIERNLAGVYVADEEGRIVACNSACARIFGYASADDLLAADAKTPYANAHDRDSIMRRLREDGAVSNEEVELTTADGRSIWALANIRLIPAQPRQGATLEGIVLDITDRKRSEEDIAFKAYHDALTRLPNRALFLDRLRVALAHAERTESELAVLFIDLDDMKAINDTLGHGTGDELLKHLADRFTTLLRRDDTVARVGGDEFLLLLTDVRGEKGVANVARRVHESLADPFIVEDEEIHATASIGVAVFPADGDTAEALIRSADGAMYRIKESGGDGFEICSRIGRSGLGRLSLEQQIRAALDHEEEFIVYYQPQVHIDTHELSGAEALVRWNHPERGVIEPGAFIAVAEQTGLIASLGETVLRQACLQMVEWRSAGASPPRVAVNVSARQFYQRNFIGMIERVLRETKCAPNYLELEITESVAMQKTDRSRTMLRRLREMGITIGIDDFGTGQSSLTYLKRFPIDTVKIDKSFVDDIEKHSNDEWIITAVLMLARQLGLRTVAEGVETDAQCGFLKEHGCAEIQGYLISRPIPADLFASRFLVNTPRRPLLTPHIEQL